MAIELVLVEEHGQSVAQEAVVGGKHQLPQHVMESRAKVQEQCRCRHALDLSNYLHTCHRLLGGQASALPNGPTILKRREQALARPGMGYFCDRVRK